MAVKTIHGLVFICLFTFSIHLQLVHCTVPSEIPIIYQQNISERALIMSENCTLAFERFSNSVLNITSCSMKYARPVQVCMECLTAHSSLVLSYQNLKEQGEGCKSFFFSSDQLGILDIMYKNANDLWMKGYCQNCYNHYDDTQRFFQASDALVLCLENTNSSSNVDINSTCLQCHESFANVSAIYNKFVLFKKEFNDGICMDIVDTMNISRRMWSKYDCAVGFDTTIGFPNILTALTVGATPLMFYLLAKNVSRLEDVKLVRPKRKVTVYTAPLPVEE